MGFWHNKRRDYGKLKNFFPNFKEFSFHRSNPHKMFKFDKDLVRVDDLILLTLGKR